MKEKRIWNQEKFESEKITRAECNGKRKRKKMQIRAISNLHNDNAFLFILILSSCHDIDTARMHKKNTNHKIANVVNSNCAHKCFA